MLGYFLNNKPFALSPDTSVRITNFNPACYTEEIPGDVAMGIELEYNEINAALLGNPDRFESYSIKSSREFPNFEIRFSGYILIAGTLIIQSADKTSYSGWCRNNVGNLGKAHRDKFISDIPAFKQNIIFNNKANYNPLTDPYGCPTHFNPEFFRDKGHIVNLTKKVPNPDYLDLSDLGQWWQDFWGDTVQPYLDEPYKTEALSAAFQKSTACFVNSLNPDNTVDTMGSTALIKKLETDLFVNVLSPMLFLNFLLDMLFRDAHFFLDKNAITAHPDLQKLILYNNFDITHVDFVTTTTSIETAPIVNENDIFYIIPATTVVTGNVIEIKRTYDSTFKYQDLIPKIKLKDFILSLQNQLNVCFHFHRDGRVDIVDREAIIDSVPISIDKYLVKQWHKGEQKDVTLKFVFTHDDNDILFSEKWVDIDDRRQDEGDPLETLEHLKLILNPKMGEIRYIKQSNTYVEYNWSVIKITYPDTTKEVEENIIGWKHLSTGFQNGFFNRKKLETEEIKTEFSTLFGDQTVMTHHMGNLETMQISYENFTPRLMFYLGNNIAKNQTDNLILDWEQKDKGLLAKRWPKWNRFWCQRQPVSTEAIFSLNMIDYVTRNITNKFYSMEGEFIIETMETEYSLENIGNTKITGFKGGYTPLVVGLDEHWSQSNLIMDDTLMDFSKMNLNFETNFDLFPFGTL